MLKAEIKKEIIITNKEIAQYLWEEGSFINKIEEILEDMLYIKYRMDYDLRCIAIHDLTLKDYVEILESLANELRRVPK